MLVNTHTLIAWATLGWLLFLEVAIGVALVALEAVR